MEPEAEIELTDSSFDENIDNNVIENHNIANDNEHRPIEGNEDVNDD